ncbi:hypothetical protein KW076_03960 [Micrococcus porci]|uniref:hypothetical protein n=1 Tax=Micrococcus TaxID=1269 RepID=UPI001CCCC989|nr:MULTISPECIES: hypothetical protein [Micrococcus]MCG7421948.1 hypothetical protein [Micrococcus sp. ACRRV]UBH25354.1 hypothetical protein KW076_03960 [Micrococcus porci]
MKPIAAAALSTPLTAGLLPVDPPVGVEPPMEAGGSTDISPVPTPPESARDGDWFAVGPTESVIVEDKINLDEEPPITGPLREAEATLRPCSIPSPSVFAMSDGRPA